MSIRIQGEKMEITILWPGIMNSTGAGLSTLNWAIQMNPMRTRFISVIFWVELNMLLAQNDEFLSRVDYKIIQNRPAKSGTAAKRQDPIPPTSLFDLLPCSPLLDR